MHAIDFLDAASLCHLLRAMLAGVVQVPRVRGKILRMKNSCIFACCGMHLYKKLEFAEDTVLRRKCSKILHIDSPTLRRQITLEQESLYVPEKTIDSLPAENSAAFLWIGLIF